MKPYFRPNISRAGRVVRGLIALTLLAAALLEFPWPVRLGLAAAGIFVAFEAFRGWCALRACGLKTRL